MREFRRDKIINGISFLLILLGSFTMLFPFLWMLSTALKEDRYVYLFPPQWIPNPVDFKNFVEIWSIAPLMSGIKNSVIITFTVIVFGTFTSSLAAFAFAKMNFKFKNLFFVAILGTMMIPFAVIMIPQFTAFSKAGMFDTLWPLILPGTLGNVSMIFFLRQYMLGLSDELMDAGKIDGCGFFKLYWSIILPNCYPALAANVILWFMSKWNEFIEPLIYINSPKKMNIQLVISTLNTYYQDQLDFPIIMASSVVAMMPIIIVFLVFQKYFIESFALTGIKG